MPVHVKAPTGRSRLGRATRQDNCHTSTNCLSGGAHGLARLIARQAEGVAQGRHAEATVTPAPIACPRGVVGAGGEVAEGLTTSR